MVNPLETRKLKILKRLNTTIESTNSILYEINRELKSVIEGGKELERVCDIYNFWISKV